MAQRSGSGEAGNERNEKNEKRSLLHIEGSSAESYDLSDSEASSSEVNNGDEYNAPMKSGKLWDYQVLAKCTIRYLDGQTETQVLVDWTPEMDGGGYWSNEWREERDGDLSQQETQDLKSIGKCWSYNVGSELKDDKTNMPFEYMNGDPNGINKNNLNPNGVPRKSVEKWLLRERTGNRGCRLKAAQRAAASGLTSKMSTKRSKKHDSNFIDDDEDGVIIHDDSSDGKGKTEAIIGGAGDNDDGKTPESGKAAIFKFHSMSGNLIVQGNVDGHRILHLRDSLNNLVAVVKPTVLVRQGPLFEQIGASQPQGGLSLSEMRLGTFEKTMTRLIGGEDIFAFPIPGLSAVLQRLEDKAWSLHILNEIEHVDGGFSIHVICNQCTKRPGTTVKAGEAKFDSETFSWHTFTFKSGSASMPRHEKVCSGLIAMAALARKEINGKRNEMIEEELQQQQQHEEGEKESVKKRGKMTLFDPDTGEEVGNLSAQALRGVENAEAAKKVVQQKEGFAKRADGKDKMEFKADELLAVLRGVGGNPGNGEEKIEKILSHIFRLSLLQYISDKQMVTRKMDEHLKHEPEHKFGKKENLVETGFYQKKNQLVQANGLNFIQELSKDYTTKLIGVVSNGGFTVMWNSEEVYNNLKFTRITKYYGGEGEGEEDGNVWTENQEWELDLDISKWDHGSISGFLVDLYQQILAFETKIRVQKNRYVNESRRVMLRVIDDQDDGAGGGAGGEEDRKIRGPISNAGGAYRKGHFRDSATVQRRVNYMLVLLRYLVRNCAPEIVSRVEQVFSEIKSYLSVWKNKMQLEKYFLQQVQWNSEMHHVFKFQIDMKNIFEHYVFNVCSPIIMRFAAMKQQVDLAKMNNDEAERQARALELFNFQKLLFENCDFVQMLLGMLQVIFTREVGGSRPQILRNLVWLDQAVAMNAIQELQESFVSGILQTAAAEFLLTVLSDKIDASKSKPLEHKFSGYANVLFTLLRCYHDFLNVLHLDENNLFEFESVDWSGATKTKISKKGLNQSDLGKLLHPVHVVPITTKSKGGGGGASMILGDMQFVRVTSHVKLHGLFTFALESGAGALFAKDWIKRCQQQRDEGTTEMTVPKFRITLKDMGEKEDLNAEKEEENLLGREENEEDGEKEEEEEESFDPSIFDNERFFDVDDKGKEEADELEEEDMVEEVVPFSGQELGEGVEEEVVLFSGHEQNEMNNINQIVVPSLFSGYRSGRTTVAIYHGYFFAGDSNMLTLSADLSRHSKATAMQHYFLCQEQNERNIQTALMQAQLGMPAYQSEESFAEKSLREHKEIMGLPLQRISQELFYAMKVLSGLETSGLIRGKMQTIGEAISKVQEKVNSILSFEGDFNVAKTVSEQKKDDQKLMGGYSIPQPCFITCSKLPCLIAQTFSMVACDDCKASCSCLSFLGAELFSGPAAAGIRFRIPNKDFVYIMICKDCFEAKEILKCAEDGDISHAVFCTNSFMNYSSGHCLKKAFLVNSSGVVCKISNELFNKRYW